MLSLRSFEERLTEQQQHACELVYGELARADPTTIPISCIMLKEGA
jgi:hypothetical protein